MEKAMILSIRPEWVVKILNGEKTIEIRKKFPKDYVGWVYIYCTQDKANLLHKNCADIYWIEDKKFQAENKKLGVPETPILNGRVVARFWCDAIDGVEQISGWDFDIWARKASISEDEFSDILPDNLVGYAIHILNLQIFDKPRILDSFYKPNSSKCKDEYDSKKFRQVFGINRAPQNYCYIEEEE